MRKPIVAGNWKMNKTVAEARALVAELQPALAGVSGVEVVLCPPFTALAAVGAALHGTDLGLGAQNMHAEKSGAYTGEISAGMLRELGCSYVILGHSERRTLFHETDELVNKKAKAALAAGLRPIVCVGETLAEREAGQTEAVVTAQVGGSLAHLGAEGLLRTVVAYEPVWAIGTGRTATTAQAQAVHALIRRLLLNMAGGSVAEAVRIQYGGSMKPGNARELMSQPDIDGGLIGGASLEAGSFAGIVRGAVK
ncbi:MAG: triose-phosphate isomerase [Kiritimatiellaeota bacterium]|nr:triose-phosphate isomerase [Kiritimatiellota bacterium]